MKSLWTKVKSGAVAFAAVLLFCVAAAAQQATMQAPIDRNGVLILVRTTLLALDDANKTGNYTVLRDLGAPGFQANTAARLGEIFASLRKKHVDLSGVAALDPQLTALPRIEPNGMMSIVGFFPSAPKQINFELLFQAVNKHWRLFGLSVKLGDAAPTPPAAPAARYKPRPAARPQKRKAEEKPKERQKRKDRHHHAGDPF